MSLTNSQFLLAAAGTLVAWFMFAQGEVIRPAAKPPPYINKSAVIPSIPRLKSDGEKPPHDPYDPYFDPNMTPMTAGPCPCRKQPDACL